MSDDWIRARLRPPADAEPAEELPQPVDFDGGARSSVEGLLGVWCFATPSLKEALLTNVDGNYTQPVMHLAPSGLASATGTQSPASVRGPEAIGHLRSSPVATPGLSKTAYGA